jgi:tetratricopeptide (TPR) repeat protein
VLRQEPANLDALILWTSSITSSNQIDAALARLATMSEKSGTLPRLALAQGTLYLQKNDRETAEQVYRTALTHNPKSWELHLALGDLYLSRRDNARAGQAYETAATLAPAASLAPLRLAQFQQRSGKAEEARQTLEKVVRQTPRFTPARQGLAELAFAAKDYPSCRSQLEQILKENPSDVAAFLLLQRTKLNQGEVDEAIQGYERLIARHPQATQAHYLLALACLQKGDHPRASSELEKAIALDPENGEATALLAELQIRSGQADRAIQALTSHLKQHPETLPARLLLASAWSAKKDLPRAEQVYRQLLATHPAAPRIHYLLGQNLAQQGNESGARAAFEDALRLEPDFAEAVEQLATLEATRQKSWDGAIARIEAQISKVPGSAALHYLLGATCLRKGDPTAAATALQKAIDRQPDSAPAYALLAQAYAALNQHDQALTKLDKALAVAPKNLSARMLKGALLQRQQRTQDAITQYEQVLAIKPDHVPAINNLACLYNEIPARRDQALEQAKRARTLAPREPAVADTLGWILYRRGEYKWALTLLQESASQLSDQAEVLYHLGSCQVATGDETAGSETLTRALAAGQEFPGAAEARALRELLAIPADGSTLPTRQEAEALLQRHPDLPSALLRAGRACERLADYPAAARYYEKAVATNPHFLPALLRLAELCLTRIEQPDRALALARQAREQAPENPAVTRAAAWIAFRAGDYTRAQSLLYEIVKGADAAPEDQYRLGLLTYASGKTEAALTLITAALQSTAGFPSAEEARRFLALVRDPATGATTPSPAAGDAIPIQTLPAISQVVETALHNGRRNEAAALCEKILKTYPDFSPALRQTALLATGQKSVPDATYKLLIKAREHLPSDPDVAQALGEACYFRKQYDTAVRLLQESADKRPERAAAFFYLGMSCEQLQRKEQARQHLTRALALDPKAEWAAEAGKLLK